MINIINGVTKKPVSSDILSKYFSENSEKFDGELYFGYPIISSPEGPFSFDAVWISQAKGLVIFCLIEGKEVGNYSEEQDKNANLLEAKLRSHKVLMQGRNLLCPPTVVTFAPFAIDRDRRKASGYPICGEENFSEVIDGIVWTNSIAADAISSVVQSISTIRRARLGRTAVIPDSLGHRLKVLEESIASLDSIQQKAVIETVEGVQRIRGLAGSGKTIVLALKAAYLHAQHPDWNIVVTFNTRSLKSQFRRLINMFVIEHTGEEPDWNMIRVINAWGTSGGVDRTGVYFEFCTNNQVRYLDFQSAKAKYGFNDAFEGSCTEAISAAQGNVKLYDVILIDEAQDFGSSFFRMCYSMLKSPNRLIYAYDELQSLTEMSLSPPEELFGKNNDGTPVVNFSMSAANQPKQDIILEKCYRNSRPVLTTAHALGFGVYREPDPKTGTGLIQMFDSSSLWEEVGYKVISGELSGGSQVTLARTPETSPKFLEEHSAIDEIIQFHVFKDKEEQASWLACAIETNLKVDELQAEDIIVINPNAITTRKETGVPRKILFEKSIASHLAGVDVNADTFFKSDGESVTFTGVFRAKGNEAGMVYIMNAQDCAGGFGNVARVRNQLFTAITRSKSWVRVLGVGSGMKELEKEYLRIKKKKFCLDFIYPTDEIRRKLNVVNRDMTDSEKAAAKEAQSKASDLIRDLDEGRISVQDLDPTVKARLQELLGRNE